MFLLRVMSCIVFLLAACGEEDDLTPSEREQRVRDRGTYCCTLDGRPTTDGCEAPAGSVYLKDFSDVDPSGRGEACGWIWDGR